jgi:hypothetical protein
MVDCFGSSADEAAEVAKGWKGFGPNIYIMTRILEETSWRAAGSRIIYYVALCEGEEGRVPKEH